MLQLALNVYMLALGVRLIVSDLTGFTENPILRAVYRATEPFLEVLRQFVPRGRQGVDWTPLVGILLIMVVRGVLVSVLSGLPVSSGLAQGVLQIEGFLVTAFSVVFLGVFFISIGTAFGFSPIGREIIRLTDPVLFPLRRLIGRAPNGVDVAAALAIVILGLMHGFLLFQFQSILGGGVESLTLGAYVWGGLAEVLDTLLGLLFYALFGRVILSWFQPDPSTPFFQILIIFTDPILTPIQRVMPWTYGMDFSPIIAALIIGFVRSNLIPLLTYAAVSASR